MSNGVDRKRRLADLLVMLRRVIISLVCSVALLAAAFVPTPMESGWMIEYSITAMAPMMPAETSETNGRDTHSRTTAVVAAKRFKLPTQISVAPPQETAPEYIPGPQKQHIPLSPELHQLAPRAPPPMC